MIIFFDIETITDEKSIENYDMWKMAVKYWDKLNFMPEFKKIFTITVWTQTKEWIVTKNLEWDEQEQIKAFFKAIRGHSMCWFNIKWFDLPFIIKRALYYQIDIPNDVKVFWKKSREMENIIDLYDIYKLMWYSSATLDVICIFLWITSPKDGWIDGSQVQTFFDEWKTEEILKYCERDVEATIKVYNYFKEYNII